MHVWLENPWLNTQNMSNVPIDVPFPGLTIILKGIVSTQFTYRTSDSEVARPRRNQSRVIIDQN